MVDLFEALADPIRRELLMRLRTGGVQSLSELVADMPVTRQAVTHHLDVLHAAGLVRVQRVGRERQHSLDARPLREVAQWLEPYAAAWDERLARLADLVSGSDASGNEILATVRDAAGS
jgi:DNA-binding transcriptional ArsR family regulator